MWWAEQQDHNTFIYQLVMLNNPVFTPLPINNGNRTEWSPTWSVIIQVINKFGQVQSGSTNLSFTFSKSQFKASNKMATTCNKILTSAVQLVSF